MVRYPKKYASENAEKFIKAKDYAKLMDWYKEFYPEMFDFKDLEMRLDLYSIEHCLNDIYYFPKAKHPRKELEGYLKK